MKQNGMASIIAIFSANHSAFRTSYFIHQKIMNLMRSVTYDFLVDKYETQISDTNLHQCDVT